jgi:hypothetical protein
MLEYTLEEPDAGTGFRLTSSDSDFPNFFFSTQELNDRTFVISKRVFYKDKKKEDSREFIGTDTKMIRAYQRAYASAIKHINSLGLNLSNTLNAERLEFLTKERKY